MLHDAKYASKSYEWVIGTPYVRHWCTIESTVTVPERLCNNKLHTQPQALGGLARAILTNKLFDIQGRIADSEVCAVTFVQRSECRERVERADDWLNAVHRSLPRVSYNSPKCVEDVRGYRFLGGTVKGSTKTESRASFILCYWQKENRVLMSRQVLALDFASWRLLRCAAECLLVVITTLPWLDTPCNNATMDLTGCLQSTSGARKPAALADCNARIDALNVSFLKSPERLSHNATLECHLGVSHRELLMQ